MKILTLNIWGAPYAKHRRERIEALAQHLEQAHLSPDILCFQEVYLPENRTDLIDFLKYGWTHFHYFPSGLVGSGLLTMSKYPIVDTAFYKFRMQGKPEDIKRGDYYAGKGVGLTRIDTPEGVVDVYNCHTHAQYDPDNDNEYAVYNETNLYDVVRFVDSHSGASPVILCGDLNTRPDQIGYEIVTQLGSLVDVAYHVKGTHPITFDSRNPYVQSDDQCLDYVLVRHVAVESVAVAMDEFLIGGVAQAFSDHYGLIAEFSLRGERLHSTDNQIAPTFETLHHRVTDTLYDAEAEQIAYWERAFFGLGSVIDGFLLGGFIKRYSETWARRLRWIGFLMAVCFAFYNMIQAGINLQNRKNTLKSIKSELDVQREANRLFDGREL
ncbi:MAG: endonuclease/exonuclease/phosphatase family protein [Chloroflexota bacterium]